ncbi:MAG: thymidine phosphorylase family protein [Planctomycetota bacterium]|nr:thymidine phosphorylase family protein [Planctomycetota bacterium]
MTPAFELRLREVALDTYRERVVVIHRQCPVFSVEGFQALARLDVRAGEGRLSAVLVIADDTSLVERHEVGLSAGCLRALGASVGDTVEVWPSAPIRSLGAVRRKIAGEVLSADDFMDIVAEIVAGQYSRTELAAFVVACGMDGLDREEVVHLTRAMAAHGKRLEWDREPVVDKHCIGGIPGNRTSMIVVPIVAAHGLCMPKTSSRAITSPAGTADTMECLARVDLDLDELRRVIRELGACIVWGGAMDLSPADDILISVERPLALDAEGQMVASILSKKVSAGSSHVLLDVPVGPTAKVRSRGRGQALRRLFRYVAGRMGVQLEVTLTDGAQPVGRGVGPALEARDVLQVLRGHPDAPPDLREKALALAGRVLEFDDDVPWGEGQDLARSILESRRAADAMEAIRDAQGRREPPEPGQLVHELRAPRDGTLLSFDNYAIARIARLAGAPLVRGAGVDILARCGDQVAAGTPVLRIHAERDVDLQFAIEYGERHPSTVVVG